MQFIRDRRKCGHGGAPVSPAIVTAVTPDMPLMRRIWDQIEHVQPSFILIVIHDRIAIESLKGTACGFQASEEAQTADTTVTSPLNAGSHG
jgi:hypothetical protein